MTFGTVYDIFNILTWQLLTQK